MMNDRYLMHYGVKGMKWGVRHDHHNASKSNKVYSTLTKKEQYYLSGGENRKYYINQKDYKSAAYSVITSCGNTPVSFLDIFVDPNHRDTGEVAVAVSKNYRKKGYAQESIRRGMEWFDNNSEMKTLVWGVHKDNSASIGLAKSSGFKRDRKWDYDKEWIAYSKKK